MHRMSFHFMPTLEYCIFSLKKKKKRLHLSPSVEMEMYSEFYRMLCYGGSVMCRFDIVVFITQHVLGL